MTPTSLGRASVSLSAFHRSRRSSSRTQRRGVGSGRLILVLALGCLLSAAGSAEARPKTIKYEVSRAGATKANYREFRYTVDAVLNDPRGWSLNGSVRFRRVSRGGRFTVRLASPRVVGSYGGCSSYYSCRVGRYVMINDARWRFATSSYRGERRHLYRQMVVNHEVGHALGFGHATCRRAGWRAPVMQQQSKGLGDCRANPWPLPGERRALARRLGVRIGPTPPGIEVGGRIGPVKLGDSREQVLGRLGAPTRQRRSGRSSVLEYRDERLRVTVAKERVTAVSTSSEAYRTRNGIRVGSTSGQVRRRLTAASCDATSCVIEGSGVLTTLVLEEGRVAKIRLERRESTTASSAARLRESGQKAR